MDFDKMKDDGYIRGVIVHVERLGDKHSNQNIREERSHLNYSLMPEGKQGIELFEDYKAAFEKVEKSQKRKIRSDAVRVVDGVLSLPAEYKGETEERQRAFFQTAADITREHFGPLLWATVHRDERTKAGDGTDHLHLGFIPVTKDGRLSAKEVIGPEALSSWHDELDMKLRERLPWYHGGVVQEEKALRTKSKDNLSMKQWKQVKAETDKVKAERDEARAEAVKAENAIHQLAQTYREKEATYSASLQQAEEKGGIASDLVSRQLAGEKLTRAEKKTIKRDLWGYGLRRTEVENQLRHDEGQLGKRAAALDEAFEDLKAGREDLGRREREVTGREKDVSIREKAVKAREDAVEAQERGIERVFQLCRNLVRRLFLKDREVYNSPEVKEIERHFGRKIVLDTEKMGPQTREKGRETHGLGRG